MRLSEHDRLAIRRVTAEVAGTGARVYLFGSRARDELKGGDIDLLVELASPTADHLAISLRTSAKLQWAIGERKVDVIVADPASPETAILRRARLEGIPL